MPQSAVTFSGFRYRTGSVVGAANKQGLVLTSDSMGSTWFIDTVNGSDTRGNGSPSKPFKTMAKAFTMLAAGDTIYFVGVVREQLVAPLLDVNGRNLCGVKIIGLSNGGPRDDDGAKWTYPASGAVAGKALLEIDADCVGWEFHNFLMTPEPNGSGGACLLWGDATGHHIVDNMRFVGIDVTTTYGIRAISGGMNLVQNSQFMLLTTGIYGTIGGAHQGWWRVLNNRFISNTNHVIMECQNCLFQDNVLYQDGTQNLNIDAAGSGATNVVQGNVFTRSAANVTVANGYNGSATDIWSANYATDALQYGSPS